MAAAPESTSTGAPEAWAWAERCRSARAAIRDSTWCRDGRREGSGQFLGQRRGLAVGAVHEEAVEGVLRAEGVLQQVRWSAPLPSPSQLC